MQHRSLQACSDECFAAARKWWIDSEGKRLPFLNGRMLMLVVSEISEGVEALRKGGNDPHLPHQPAIAVEMADTFIRLCGYAAGTGLKMDWADIPKNKEYFTRQAVFQMGKSIDPIEQLLFIVKAVMAIYDDRTADSVARALHFIMRFCEIHSLPLEGCYVEKLEYNKTRLDHSQEAMESEGGRRF
jgi:hypothetical protein